MENPDNSRMLLELDVKIQQANRDMMNTNIPEVNLDSLSPLIAMVARARSDYLSGIFEVAGECASSDTLPEQSRIQDLAGLRATYEELLAGARALEVAVERGYVDVHG